MSKKSFKDVGNIDNFNSDIMDRVYQGENISNINDNKYMEDTPQQDSKPLSSKERKQNKNDIIDNENPKVYTSKKAEENKKKRENDPTLTTDEKGNRNRNNNYAITIKIDEDLREYFTKIEWVKMLTERESTTKNKYINNLVRQDMLSKLNLNENATNEQIKKAWDNFKKANNI